MKTFKIEILEFLSEIVEIEANSVDEAISEVKKRYYNEQIVLDDTNFVTTEFNDMDCLSKNDEKKQLTKEIIEYLYSDEKKHFEELYEPSDHIFIKLERLKRIIEGD